MTSVRGDQVAGDRLGWEHYADGWSVRLSDGTELGYRTLVHPHVEEQPFTRSLDGVNIPEGTERLVLVPTTACMAGGSPSRWFWGSDAAVVYAGQS